MRRAWGWHGAWRAATGRGPGDVRKKEGVRGANLPGLVLACHCLKEVGEGGVACREAGRVRKMTKKKKGGRATHQGWGWRAMCRPHHVSSTPCITCARCCAACCPCCVSHHLSPVSCIMLSVTHTLCCPHRVLHHPPVLSVALPIM